MAHINKKPSRPYFERSKSKQTLILLTIPGSGRLDRETKSTALLFARQSKTLAVIAPVKDSGKLNFLQSTFEDKKVRTVGDAWRRSSFVSTYRCDDASYVKMINDYQRAKCLYEKVDFQICFPPLVSIICRLLATDRESLGYFPMSLQGYGTLLLPDDEQKRIPSSQAL